MERELNVQANVKTKNGKNLKVKILVDSGCTHTEINEQLVKEKRIQIKPINFSFEVFNANRIKNGEITKVVPLEIKINRHKEFIRCLGSYKMKHQDIKFKTRRTQTMEIKEQNNREIGKEPDKMNLEDLLEYI